MRKCGCVCGINGLPSTADTLGLSYAKCRYKSFHSLHFHTLEKLKLEKGKYDEHSKSNGMFCKMLCGAQRLLIHCHTLTCIEEFLLVRQDHQGFEFLICSACRGNTKSARGIIPLFQFHTLYKAEFKALLTSIIKAIYTKKKKKNTPIYRNTQPANFP